MAVQTGPHDAQDGDDEQDGDGHIRADEGGGEDGGHDMNGGRGGMGQRSEKAGDGAGEGAEDEGVEAERPDTGARVSVGYVSPSGASIPCAVPRITRVPWRRGASPTVSQVACQEAAGVSSSASQRCRAGRRSRARARASACCTAWRVSPRLRPISWRVRGGSPSRP